MDPLGEPSTATDPASTTAASSLSMSSTSASYMYRDALPKLGPLSASTWPRWAQLLPKVVAGYAGVAGAEWYLKGSIAQDEYTAEKMPEVLGDPAKQRVYDKWTRLGDAPGLWSKLEEWYGWTETGVERVVQVAELFSSRWDETSSPAVWIADLRKKQAVINSAYEADAKKATDKTDRNVVADLNAAISDNLLRDIILAFLPSSTADPLLTSVSRTTSLDELQTLIVNLHATRISRETIAGIDGRGKRGKSQKLPATRYAGYERWRGGTFRDANGTTRFKVPAGSCFGCFKSDGHMVRDCPTADQARSRVEEMKKDGITVPIHEAMALHTLDLNDCADTPDGPTLAAFRTNRLPRTRRSPYLHGATRHFTTRLDHLHDYRPYPAPRPVGGAFGSGGHALGEGTLVLTLLSGPIAISDVMYVPGLGVNLLSQTRLMLSGMRFSNDRRRLIVKDENGQAIMELEVTSPGSN
ncbi:hypothetical protein JCM1840_001754 [Sporobolomyces johnsonii]